MLPVVLRIVDANQETQKPGWKYVQCLPAHWSASQKFQTESPLCNSLQTEYVIAPFPDEQTALGLLRVLPSQAGKRQRTAWGTPSWPNIIADNSMDGTTEFLEETWHCFYEHQVMLMFSSSSVKLPQHTWDAKEVHCMAACLSKSH